MSDRVVNNKGFTLAELLITIAITLALAGLAIPGFMSTMNNMRMNELNSAAESIATAAQSRMTGMKSSGTWASMLNEQDEVYLSQTAHALPSENADIFYFSAEQARDNGVLPRNSIDDALWNSDYIIEYCRSTATVCGIFYSDGTGSFFSSTEVPAGETPAQDYYLAMSSSDAREHQARMDASPTIGYYWGTPTGATDTVILDNPIIWIDEETSQLCIQNINLRNSDDYQTSLSVTIGRIEADHTETPGYQFVIDNVRESSSEISPYTLTTKPRINNKQNGLTPTNEGEIVLEKRNDSATRADVFAIDLNQIRTILANADSQLYDDLISVARGFASEDDIKIEAEITMVSEGVTATTPAKATAFAKWPGIAERLTMLVTNPNFENSKAGHISGTYNAPKVEITDKHGEKPRGPAPTTYSVDKIFALPSTGKALSDENPEAARQVYNGKTVLISSASNYEAHMLATVGSYTSTGYAATEHHYQIFEIWLNDSKIGYLHNNAWVWTTLGATFSECIVSGPTAGLDTAGIRSVRINPARLGSLSEELQAMGVDASEGYNLYIRTAPARAEVQSYVVQDDIKYLLFTLTSEFSNFSPQYDGLISSRTIMNQDYASYARQTFEDEFGASSAVASWSFTGVAVSDIHGFGDGLRYYYAGTPAFGFEDTLNLANPEYKADNAALWYFSLTGAQQELVEEPAAMVQDPRTAGGVSDNLAPYNLVAGSASDFELSHTQDALFCRVLFYHTRTGEYIPSYTQYVPHVTEYSETLKAGQSQEFVYWKTRDTFPAIPAGKDLVCFAGSPVGNTFNYDSGQSAFRWGRVNLVAADITVGLVYFEQYSDGTMGYYGYTDARLTEPDIHQNMDYNNAKTINNWGYYVVLPTAMVNLDITPQYNSAGLFNTGISFLQGVDNVSYSCFYLPNAIGKTTNQFLHCRFTTSLGFSPINYSAYYYLNLNFAKAVETRYAVAAQWGIKGGYYPYYVRHIDQFIGCLGSSVRDSYMASYFEQQHNIAFNSSVTAPAYATTTFKGIYEGGNYEIHNYKPEAYGTNLGNNLYVGLFYRTEDATIRNLALRNVVSNTVNVATSGSVTTYRLYAGYFASQSLKTTFDNCSVIGNGQNTTYLDLPATGGNLTRTYHPYVGGIVGWSTNCTIKDCQVADLTLKATRSGTFYVTRYSMGGLLGHGTSGTTTIARSNSRLLVQNVTLSVDINRVANDSGVGALVGTKLNGNGAVISWPGSVGYTYSNVYNAVESSYLGTGDFLGRDNRANE